MPFSTRLQLWRSAYRIVLNSSIVYETKIAFVQRTAALGKTLAHLEKPLLFERDGSLLFSLPFLAYTLWLVIYESERLVAGARLPGHMQLIHPRHLNLQDAKVQVQPPIHLRTL